MIPSVWPVVVWVAVSSFVLLSPPAAQADGGAVRLYERAAGYRIAVFTSPTPVRAGPVDVSVLVQDAATSAWAQEVSVMVRLTARATGRVLEQPATTEAATNKLFRAAIVPLPEPGRWDVEVAVDGPRGPALVRFELVAAGPAPRWRALWPWFVWPALAIVLFGIHERLVRRRSR